MRTPVPPPPGRGRSGRASGAAAAGRALPGGGGIGRPDGESGRPGGGGIGRPDGEVGAGRRPAGRRRDRGGTWRGAHGSLGAGRGHVDRSVLTRSRASRGPHPLAAVRRAARAALRRRAAQAPAGGLRRRGLGRAAGAHGLGMRSGSGAGAGRGRSGHHRLWRRLLHRRARWPARPRRAPALGFGLGLGRDRRLGALAGRRLLGRRSAGGPRPVPPRPVPPRQPPSWPPRLLGRRLLLGLGLLGLLVASQAVTVGATADHVGVGLVERRRVALHGHAEHDHRGPRPPGWSFPSSLASSCTRRFFATPSFNLSRDVSRHPNSLQLARAAGIASRPVGATLLRTPCGAAPVEAVPGGGHSHAPRPGAVRLTIAWPSASSAQRTSSLCGRAAGIRRTCAQDASRV